MDNFKIAKVLSIIVVITGSAVMAGWILDIPVLKSILPQWVTMKFSTALCFFLSGVTLYFVVDFHAGRTGFAQVVISVATLTILLFMATLLMSTFLGLRTGIEDLFVKEAPGAVKSVMPGRPSVGTMADFILIAAAGILTMFRTQGLKLKHQRIGWVIVIIGCIAVAGYVLNKPFLYYAVEGWSTAMALHTAILFIISGAALVLAGPADIHR